MAIYVTPDSHASQDEGRIAHTGLIGLAKPRAPALAGHGVAARQRPPEAQPHRDDVSVEDELLIEEESLK